jgi:hypothetical protein
VSQNKSDLIDLLCKDLLKHKDHFQLHRLVITESGPVPLELNYIKLHERVEIQLTGFKKTEEVDTIIDTIIIHKMAVVKPQSVIVFDDDTSLC